ncbi:MAG: hypothetical protein HFG02_11645 [Oscillibacter sp.]|nr:hypothetical protein [Oscillibacter sp.]
MCVTVMPRFLFLMESIQCFANRFPVFVDKLSALGLFCGRDGRLFKGCSRHLGGLCWAGRLLFRQDISHNAFNFFTAHCGNAHNVRCFGAMDIMKDRAGEERRLIAPLPVQKINHQFLLGIGDVEPHGKLAGVFFL